MSFWNRKKDYSVCEQCGVHFEPVKHSDFPNLCSVHRKEPEDLKRRERAVLHWAAQNWQSLEAQMEKDEATRRVAYNANLAAQMQAMAASQQSRGICGGLGEVFGMSQQP